jgi:hypothetical protein
LKLHKGNDLCALVVMSPAPVIDPFQELYMTIAIPAAVQEVILVFDNLFQAPTELPPSRVFDHSISLLPDTIPINYMPYRYNPQQKDEIE